MNQEGAVAPGGWARASTLGQAAQVTPSPVTQALEPAQGDLISSAQEAAPTFLRGPVPFPPFPAGKAGRRLSHAGACALLRGEQGWPL